MCLVLSVFMVRTPCFFSGRLRRMTHLKYGERSEQLVFRLKFKVHFPAFLPFLHDRLIQTYVDFKCTVNRSPSSWEYFEKSWNVANSLKVLDRSLNVIFDRSNERSLWVLKKFWHGVSGNRWELWVKYVSITFTLATLSLSLSLSLSRFFLRPVWER